MATTITPSAGSLKVEFTLNFGTKDYGFTKTIAYNAVTNAMQDIMTLPLGLETEIVGIAAIAAAPGMGRGIFDSFNLLILTNQDDTNFARIRMSKNGGDTFDYKLLPGQLMIITSDQIEVNTTQAAFGAFVSADMISGQPDTATVDIEYTIIKI